MGALAVGLAGTTGSIVLADPAIRRLLQTATAAAADNATRLGAGVVDVRAVRRLAEEVRVEPLV
jgi:fructose-1-phosphate kinase PfkB-like protein